MELKWILVSTLLLYLSSSNRTFMELKFSESIDEIIVKMVLIVPLWN